MNTLRIFVVFVSGLVFSAHLGAQEPKPRSVFKVDPKESIQSLAFSPDSKLLAVGIRPGVQLWDISTGKKVATFSRESKVRGPGVRALAFSPDGKLLAAGGYRAVHVWEIATGKSLAVLQGNTNEVASVAFHPDGKKVAAAGDRTARVWDIATGKAEAVLEHSTQTSNVAFSPDGKRLAVADFGRLIRIWDPAKGKAPSELKGHVGFVFDLAYRSDGKGLASAGQDGTVRLWNPATAQATVLRHGLPVRSLAFRPGGQEIVAADEGRVILWSAAGKELARSRPVSLESLCVVLDSTGSYLVANRSEALTKDVPPGSEITGRDVAVLWEVNVLLAAGR